MAFLGTGKGVGAERADARLRPCSVARLFTAVRRVFCSRRRVFWNSRGRGRGVISQAWGGRAGGEARVRATEQLSDPRPCTRAPSPRSRVPGRAASSPARGVRDPGCSAKLCALSCRCRRRVAETTATGRYQSPSLGSREEAAQGLSADLGLRAGYDRYWPRTGSLALVQGARAEGSCLRTEKILHLPLPRFCMKSKCNTTPSSPCLHFSLQTPFAGST